MMAHTVVALAMLTLTLHVLRATDKAGIEVSALDYLERIAGVDSGVSSLAEQRPAPLPDAARAKVIAGLPVWEDLVLHGAQRDKVEGVRPVLALFERKTVSVRVARLPFACTAFYERSVLIFSESAARILTMRELQAVAAHELAHEYFWDAYYVARLNGDNRELQRLELLADGIAVLMLARLGVQAGELTSAVHRLNNFNERNGASSNSDQYPSWEQRKSVHLAVARMLRSH